MIIERRRRNPSTSTSHFCLHDLVHDAIPPPSAASSPPLDTGPLASTHRPLSSCLPLFVEGGTTRQAGPASNADHRTPRVRRPLLWYQNLSRRERQPQLERAASRWASIAQCSAGPQWWVPPPCPLESGRSHMERRRPSSYRHPRPAALSTSMRIALHPPIHACASTRTRTRHGQTCPPTTSTTWHPWQTPRRDGRGEMAAR